MLLGIVVATGLQLCPCGSPNRDRGEVFSGALAHFHVWNSSDLRKSLVHIVLCIATPIQAM